ncbi:hypothetical protein VTL71DRAFT_5991 [Oculimacula yallundae]|uniref:Heterokaryon incompatibility domain-containing protein n=1 Tax=Oculimacula yallundae TaxID=86028 RepID=A0ABR4BZ33_9HELO
MKEKLGSEGPSGNLELVSASLLSTTVVEASLLTSSRGNNSLVDSRPNLVEATNSPPGKETTLQQARPSEEIMITSGVIEDGADAETRALKDRIIPHEAIICSCCQSLVETWPTPRGVNQSWEVPHHKDFGALEAAANAGCGLCYQFINSVEREVRVNALKERQGAGPPFSRLRIKYVFSPESSYFYLWFKRPGVEFEDLPSVVAVEVHDLSLGTYGKSMPATGAKLLIWHLEESLQMSDWTTKSMLWRCKSWISTCAASHASCRIPRSRQLPTRLLSIGGNTVYICLTSELDGYPAYATLSHCWGTRAFRTLTRDNFEDFQQAVPSEALSNTFRDAIRVARDVDIQYLWIDSLCIIQDDEADWARESAMMSSVYGCSTVNIAASAAQDGSYGCYLERDKQRGSRVRTTLGILDCVPGFKSYHASLYQTAVSFRGWILQERILPIRTLHFTSSEVFWECNNGLASEKFPQRIPAGYKFAHWTRSSLDNDAGWMNIVRRYSKCKITQSKDKLVAISGLARIVQEAIKDEYKAGFWMSNLLRQLCWFSRARNRSRISPYVAPTWSWASVDGEIEWSSYSSTTTPSTVLPEILALSIISNTDNSFGQISAASLQLSCSYFISVQLQGYSRDAKNLRDVKLPSGESLPIRLWLDTISSKDELHLYLLPIIRSDTANLSASILSWISGLILVRIGADEDEKYKRVGMFEVNESENKFTDYQERLLGPKSQGEGWEPDKIFIDGDGSSRVHITIV